MYNNTLQGNRKAFNLAIGSMCIYIYRNPFRRYFVSKAIIPRGCFVGGFFSFSIQQNHSKSLKLNRNEKPINLSLLSKWRVMSLKVTADGGSARWRVSICHLQNVAPQCTFPTLEAAIFNTPINIHVR